MQTIAVYSRKGGAGKSAITVLLAETLACYPFMQRVLVVDLDPQQSSSTAMLGDERLHAALQQGQSVTGLIRARHNGPIAADEARKRIAVRPPGGTKGRKNFLQAVSLLAPDREDWHALNEQLRDESREASDRPAINSLLREALSTLDTDFDICLIDFPGHDDGPLVRCGLVASDRWLFPVVPDRMGVRDLDGTRRVIREAYLGQPRNFKRLGTLLNMCQNSSSPEYRRAKKRLAYHAEQRQIPTLFEKDAELGFWSEVKTALDELVVATTLDKKMGGGSKPLLNTLTALAQETMTRLRISYNNAAEGVEVEASVNEEVTKNW